LPTKFFYPTPFWQPKNGFTLEPELIYAFAHQESMFNENAKSPKGAMGLMQVMPSTAKFITTNKQVKRNNANILKIPEINLEVGQEYIEYLLKLKSVDNNLIYLTAAYNGGPGNLQKWQEKTNHLDDPLFFMESIPSRETRWFIEKVLTKYWIYQNKKGIESKSLRLLANGKEPIY
jgi:soluble lytic murein transglycosylase-like protein